MSGGRGEWARIALLFTVLAAAATWPQIVRPDSIPDHRDAWLNLWRLAWVAHQLPRDPAHLFDANIHYPEKRTLAYSDATLLQGIVAAPFLWMGVALPHVHTALVIGSFVFSGVAMWMLVTALTGMSSAGIAAGIVFAFAPYRFDHYMHLELLWSGWMPLTLLMLHRTFDAGARGAGVAAGLLFAAQGFSSIYYAVFFATALVPFVLLACDPKRLRWRSMLALCCGALIAGLLLRLYLTPYRDVSQTLGERSEAEALMYSAGPGHYLSATPDNSIYGGLADRFGRAEKRLFPGLVALGLAAAALWPPLSRVRLAYLAGLLLALDLSLGPRGLSYGFLREYAFPYRGLRVPARAAAVALVFLAALAGFGWARVRKSPWVRRLPSGWPAVILIVLAAEYIAVPRQLISAPTQPEPVYAWLASRPDDGAVVEIPLPDEHALPLHDAQFAHRSTFHWHRIVNGYSGNVPASYVEFIRLAREFPSEAALAWLREARVRYIVVHERFLGRAEYGVMLEALRREPGFREHGPFGSAGQEATVFDMNPIAGDGR